MEYKRKVITGNTQVTLKYRYLNTELKYRTEDVGGFLPLAKANRYNCACPQKPQNSAKKILLYTSLTHAHTHLKLYSATRQQLSDTFTSFNFI